MKTREKLQILLRARVSFLLTCRSDPELLESSRHPEVRWPRTQVVDCPSDSSRVHACPPALAHSYTFQTLHACSTLNNIFCIPVGSIDTGEQRIAYQTS